MNMTELLERWRQTTQAIDDWEDAHKVRVGRPNLPRRRGCTNRLRNVAKELAELLTDLIEAKEGQVPQ